MNGRSGLQRVLSVPTSASALAAALLACGTGGPGEEFPYEVELQHIATISDRHDPGMLSLNRPLAVQRDSRGRLYAITARRDGIAVYHADGRFLTRLGRHGSGPGEFRMALPPIPGPGDSIHVFDMGLRRTTVFGPEMHFVRTVRVPYWPAMVAQHGYYVIAEQIPTGEHIGYPIHVWDHEGSFSRSFGTDNPEYLPGQERTAARNIGPAGDTAVWAGAPGRYVFEKWDLGTGSRLARVEPEADWFSRPHDRYAYADPSHGPTAVGLWEDDEGFLWVLVHTAKISAIEDLRTAYEHERALDMAVYSEQFESIIEVLDPATATAVARSVFPRSVQYRAPSPLLTTLRAAELDGSEFDVWRPILVRREVR
jgi:hypothetical protein